MSNQHISSRIASLRIRPPGVSTAFGGLHVTCKPKPPRHPGRGSSRTGASTGAAAGPVLAFPAGVIPPEPDPILAAIEEHRRAWAEFVEPCNEEADQELNRLYDHSTRLAIGKPRNARV
jgi:hypothetical protein